MPPNLTETQFLQILKDLTKNQTNEKDKNQEIRTPGLSGSSESSHDYYVDRLNLTTKQSLTPEQYSILKIVEDLSIQSAKAGFMSKLFQCVRSLSFLRCMGIFVWPMISQNLPQLPTLGSLNPFARSQNWHETSSTLNIHQIFGLSTEEFESEFLHRKDKIENLLTDWYRSIVDEKYSNDYGILRIQGYGDGEIGISLKGPIKAHQRTSRKGRVAVSKFKDNKNLPSILTIISDIMEDVLESRPTNDNDKRKDNGKRVSKSIHDNDLESQSTKRSRLTNDDEIIAMFLNKIRPNVSDSEDEEVNKQYLTVEDAYDAFELLFGRRLSQRFAEKLNDLGTKKTFLGFEDSNEDSKIRTGLFLRLPKIDEDFVISRRHETSGRKVMKMEMSQVIPGVSFVISFFIQMFLAHARTAASVASMMSNMALGSAVVSMLRQSFFGPMTHPKIKYVYDNAPMGPGIAWPMKP